MKVAIFYRDAFQCGGVPKEIREIATALAAQHEVALWGRGGAAPESMNPAIQCQVYHNLSELNGSFSNWLKESKPNLLLLVGLFFYENFIAVRLAKQHRIPVVLNPVGQVTQAVLTGKIFTQDPDVRKLEQTGPQIPPFKNQLMRKANPLLKQVYLNSLGRMIFRNSDLVAVFSPFEARQFRTYLPLSRENFVQLQWGIDQFPQENDQSHYYRDILGYKDGKSNFVYWGRMDWHYKGLDRLLNGVLQASKKNISLPFRIFLVGPDYSGGADRIQKFVQQHQLQDAVHLMLPGSYPSGSKMPLRDADASVYLSRWDGFPRTLRESILLGIPVLVSEETHFGDYVSDYGSGIALSNADSNEEVANALLQLVVSDEREKFKAGTARLAPHLTWQHLTRTFMQDCQHALQYNAQYRMALP